MWVYIVVALVTIPLAWFLWTAGHELSHVLMAKAFRKISDVRYRLYPHFTASGTFRFAAVSWNPQGNPLKPKERAAIWLAPRILDGLAVLFLPLAVLFNGPSLLAWLIFWGSGLVDLGVGSTGMSEISDLRRASDALGWSPWALRILGFGFLVASATLTLTLLFLL